MNRVISESDWSEFLKSYTTQNENRPTRLGVFESNDGTADDLWIEDGLPLVGVDAYTNQDKICVDILFDSFTHHIDGVGKIVDIDNGSDRGLDISDVKGRTTILRFEDWPIRKEN